MIFEKSVADDYDFLIKKILMISASIYDFIDYLFVLNTFARDLLLLHYFMKFYSFLTKFWHQYNLSKRCLQMLKKEQHIEQSVLTEPQTPPNLQLNPVNNSTSQNIHRIIASNEELIHQQMMTIRILQADNSILEDKLKSMTAKYEAVCDLALQKKNRDQRTININSNTSAKFSQGDFQEMLAKICQLQQQLSTTKVELAVKSAELLTLTFQHKNQQESSKRRKTQSEDNLRQNIQKYFEPLPTNHESFPGKPAENKQLTENWSKSFQQYGSQTKMHKFKQKSHSLIKRFIPHELRGKIWPLCIQNKLGMTNSLYIQLLQRRQKGWVCQKVRIQIDKDIKRSFYGKTAYQTKTGFIDEVVELLQIFHIFRPDVSYIQGMTYPAMILIPVLGKIKAFNLFANLILGNSFFRKLFSMEGNFINVICRGFEALLEQHLPQVAKKFQEMSLQSQIYLIQWLFTFFSRGISIDSTLKFWDQLLYFEEVAIFRMAISVFEQLQPLILTMSFEQVVNLVRQYGQFVRQQKLMEGLVSNKLNNEKLYKMLDKFKI